jgi:hypothetical protein
MTAAINSGTPKTLWKLRTRGHSISRDRLVAGAINVALE